jgi:hypothetical protein
LSYWDVAFLTDSVSEFLTSLVGLNCCWYYTGLLTAAPAFAEGVSFVTPSNGKAVSSPVHVEFAVDGLTVRPAGKPAAADQQAQNSLLKHMIQATTPLAMYCDSAYFTVASSIQVLAEQITSVMHVAFTIYSIHFTICPETVVVVVVSAAADGLVPGTGHFHVYVDVPASQQPGEGEAIPFDDAHKHFGKGQTAADLELTPVSGWLLACVRVS